MTMHRRWVASMWCALAIGATADVTTLHAQRAEFRLGETDRLVAAAGAPIRVPVILQLGGARPVNLAAFQVVVRWDPQQLIFDSLRVVAPGGLTVTSNPSTAPDGVLRFNGFAPAALRTSGPLLELVLRARPGVRAAALSADLEAAGDELGRSVAGQVRTRGVSVCLEGCR